MKRLPQFHQVIFDSLHEGLYSVDKNFRITGFNQVAEKITGFRREEVLGKFCKNIMRTDRCREGCPLAYSLELKEDVRNYNLIIKNANDKAVPVKVNSAVFNSEDGQPVGGVVVFRTATDFDKALNGDSRRVEYAGIIGQSAKMQEVYTLIEELAHSDAGVLVQGESGTGKELVANAIQATSQRKKKPYIKVNCSVFSHNLLASELFGHVKGAFTDAHKDRIGRFEMADGGTIFLDEIAETDQRIQLQLLRVLQEGTFERLGDSVTHSVNVRVIAATNLNIKEAIADGRFRDDLYYRLNVIPLFIPPLRERIDDVPFLIDHFLNKLAIKTGKKIDNIDESALDVLRDYDWPGNVRELENVIEYAHTRSQNGVITETKLPPALFENTKRILTGVPRQVEPVSEAGRIRAVLEEVHWNRSKAAEKLGMGRATLWRKMKQYHLMD